MQSQVSFTVDHDIKRQVLAKVKEEGITLKVLLTHVMKSFAAGNLTFGLHTNIQDNEPELLAKVAKIAKLLK